MNCRPFEERMGAIILDTGMTDFLVCDWQDKAPEARPEAPEEPLAEALAQVQPSA